MEAGPGVFVSSIDTDDWATDPVIGGELHVLAAVEGAFVGMSRFAGVADPEPWVVAKRETIVVLEGAARIEIDGGPTLELGVGDVASLPKGALTTRHLTQPYREIWFFARPYEGASRTDPLRRHTDRSDATIAMCSAPRRRNRTATDEQRCR